MSGKFLRSSSSGMTRRGSELQLAGAEPASQPGSMMKRAFS